MLVGFDFIGVLCVSFLLIFECVDSFCWCFVL